MSTSRTAYHPAAKVDRGGRNTKQARLLRDEHIRVQRAIAAQVVAGASHVKAIEHKVNTEVDRRNREIRELMGAPSPRF